MSFLRKKSFRHWPLWWQILALLLTIFLLSSLLTTRFTRQIFIDFELGQLSDQAEDSYTLLSALAEDAVISKDVLFLSSFAKKTLQHSRNMQGISIKNEHAELLTQHLRAHDIPSKFIHSFEHSFVIEGESLGSIEILWDSKEIEEKINQNFQQIEQVFHIILLAFTALFLILIHWIAVKPLKRITEHLTQLSTNDNRPMLINTSSITNPEILLLSNAADALSQLMQEQITYSAKLKNTLEDYRTSHAKNNAILSSSLDSIITIDTNGVVIDYNKVAHKTFGWAPEEVIGRPIVDFIIPHEMRNPHTEGMQKFMLTGDGPVLGQRMELTALRKNGDTFPIEISISEINTSSNIIFSAFIRDISDQKEYELILKKAKQDAESANKSTSSFLATMSHEMRTPLNAIIGVLGLLAHTPMIPEQKQLVKTGRNSSELLLIVINDILDFSKMEVGKVTLENICFDLHYLLRDTLEILQALIGEKNLTINLNIDPALPEFVMGDPDRFRQILTNLIHNAIKFTLEGSITIQARGIHVENEFFDFQCVIQDTGIGISRKNQSILFEPFTMVDQTHSRSFEGTGLGLAICQRLSSLMGGIINVDSEIGKGSTFTFMVRLKEGIKEDCLYRNESNKNMRIPKENTRILLAEDNSANQMVIKKILELANQKVDIANDGLEALEAVSSNDYDLILMDISMPKIDGLESVRRIKQLPEKNQIPIIALTAHALEGDRERFLAAGMDHFLTKPIQRSSLLDNIARLTSPEKTKDIEIEGDSQLQLTDNESSNEFVDELILRQLLKDTSAEVVPELLRSYISDAKVRLDKIQQAVKHSDAKTLEFEAHTLSSSAITYGNRKLHTQLRKLERLCIDKNIEQAFLLAKPMLELAEASFLMLEKRVIKGFK